MLLPLKASPCALDPWAEEQRHLTLDSPPPTVSIRTTMHLPVQWPVQARQKMPPGAEGGSNMSSGTDFVTNSNFKNLKNICLAVSWKRDLTLAVCKPFKRSSKWCIHHDGQIGVKDYWNYGGKVHAWSCAYTYRDIFQQHMHSQILKMHLNYMPNVLLM